MLQYMIEEAYIKYIQKNNQSINQNLINENAFHTIGDAYDNGGRSLLKGALIGGLGLAAFADPDTAQATAEALHGIAHNVTDFASNIIGHSDGGGTSAAGELGGIHEINRFSGDYGTSSLNTLNIGHHSGSGGYGFNGWIDPDKYEALYKQHHEMLFNQRNASLATVDPFAAKTAEFVHSAKEVAKPLLMGAGGLAAVKIGSRIIDSHYKNKYAKNSEKTTNTSNTSKSSSKIDDIINNK